ncbi:hypothetical protein M9H77_29629 [Catharanthus roseus]|uniref:Uncharacterized protein n=1 Tax=Catharanthus roseus TaxID=4058 RepID=A0ACB9ZXJ4_CATRO|nr:hypothetical protein M9H77_29629 [Catharanthus roseus]
MLCTRESPNASSSTPRTSQEFKWASSSPPEYCQWIPSRRIREGAVEDEYCVLGSEDEPRASPQAGILSTSVDRDPYVFVDPAMSKLTDPALWKSMFPFVS